MLIVYITTSIPLYSKASIRSEEGWEWEWEEHHKDKLFHGSYVAIR